MIRGKITKVREKVPGRSGPQSTHVHGHTHTHHLSVWSGELRPGMRRWPVPSHGLFPSSELSSRPVMVTGTPGHTPLDSADATGPPRGSSWSLFLTQTSTFYNHVLTMLPWKFSSNLVSTPSSPNALDTLMGATWAQRCRKPSVMEEGDGKRDLAEITLWKFCTLLCSFSIHRPRTCSIPSTALNTGHQEKSKEYTG